MTQPNRNLSPERKAAYYVGVGIGFVGFLTFASVFVTGAMNFGDFTDFDRRAKSMMTRAFVGMGLVIVGGVIASVSSHGLHGSRVLLDPGKERQDLEPWSRMQGGMIDDALSEVKSLDRLAAAPAQPATQVKVRCRQCAALNDEEARFCDQCGAAL